MARQKPQREPEDDSTPPSKTEKALVRWLRQHWYVVLAAGLLGGGGESTIEKFTPKVMQSPAIEQRLYKIESKQDSANERLDAVDTKLAVLNAQVKILLGEKSVLPLKTNVDSQFASP